MEPEDSMEAISPVSMNTISGGDQIDRLLSQAVNIGNNMVLHEPTCMICSSPYREEIEQKHLETKSYAETIKFFEEKTGNKISKGVIENHMKFHHDKEMRELQKIEYIDRIKRHSGQNLTTLDRISICFSIVSERLMGVNSVIPSADESIATIEKMKSSETARLMGVLNNLLKLQAGILGEMKSSGELISIPANDFVQIINKALSECQSDRERKLVKGIIDSLDALSRRAQ
jgi:hypothetical protein